MKKLFALMCLLALVGFGCAPSQTPSTPTSESSPDNTVSTTQETPTPEPAPTPSPAPTPVEEETSPSNDLKAFPVAAPPTVPIDDSGWTQTVTRAGVTITAPTTGTYAPTWTYTSLSANDANIQSGCYVTSGVMYQQANSPTSGYCHTATAFDANAGTRTDYYLAVGTSRTDLWTFTKTYPVDFNHNDYKATLDHIIGILD